MPRQNTVKLAAIERKLTKRQDRRNPLSRKKIQQDLRFFKHIESSSPTHTLTQKNLFARQNETTKQI